MRLPKLTPKLAVIFALGVLLGTAVMVAVRFAIYKPSTVHYHANFALYVNGVRDQFKGPGYYEEVQSCNDNNSTDPRERAHMHGNVNDVVHVHAKGVSWGAFFANLGYTLGDSVLVTTNGTFVNGPSGKLSFILNGKTVDKISNQLINDNDALLINYGKDSTSTLTSRYNAIPHTAHQYDIGKDPLTCSGSQPLTFWKRLQIALGANQ